MKTVSKLPYRDIPSALSQFEEFDGNSMHAYTEDNGNIYNVFSYRTRILRIDHELMMYEFNRQKYSSTTSHHQNLCRDLIENYLTDYREF